MISKTTLKNILLPLLLSLTGLFTGTVLADEEPLPVEKAFKTSVTVKDANTLVATWKIAKGYYLYRNKIKFDSKTAGISFGDAKIPQGKKKKDPLFGLVQIFRDTVSVEIPVKRTDGKATNLDIVVHSQGCADIGLCYPPQKNPFKLGLPVARVAAGGAGNKDPVKEVKTLGKNLGLQDDEQDFLPNEQAFKAVVSLENGKLNVVWQIAPGYYLYRNKTKFTMRSSVDGVKLGEIKMPAGKIKKDPLFGKVAVFYTHANASTALQGKLTDANTRVELAYQGCADKGLCYPPTYRLITLNKTGIVSVSKPKIGTGFAKTAGSTKAAPKTKTPAKTSPAKSAKAEPPANEETFDKIIRILNEGNIAAILPWMLLFGLLAAFTACMYPMIPIVSSIIIGQGENTSAFKGLILSLVYVLAMAVVFGLIGAGFGYAGAHSLAAVDLRALAQVEWVLWIFFGLFFVFALAMFGVINIQLPSALQSRISNVSNKQKSGTLIGVAIMGGLSALIIGPCGGPILAAALTGAFTSKSAFSGFLYLFTMGIGMGAPLLLVGLFGGAFLPRAGTWMGTVKAVGGIILLAVAIFILERILFINKMYTLYMLIWAIFFICVGVFMGALEPIKEGARGTRILWKGLGVALIVYGAVVAVGGLTGSKFAFDPFHGSRLLGGGSAATKTVPTDPRIAAMLKKKMDHIAGKKTKRKGILTFVQIKTKQDLLNEIRSANAKGFTVMLDFYADWCTYCIQFDEYVFNQPAVRDAFANTILLQVDITKMNKHDKELLAHTKVPTPPGLIFYGKDGKETGKRVYALMKWQDFLKRIELAFGKL